jgi:hypothetical protein
MKTTLVVLLAGVTSASAAPVTTESRTPGTFHAVELKGAVGVEIRVDSKTSVEVTGEPDAIKHISTDVKAGSLVIDMTGNVNTHEKLKVVVTTPSLDTVALTGAGNMRVSGVKASGFAVGLGGAGNIEITGAADDLSVELTGPGNINAKDLPARSATVKHEGTGNVTVTATDKLVATLTGVGNVTVYGHPKSVSKSVTGIGSIRMR